MAAPCKMCKSDRRLHKKRKKSQHTLKKHENVIILNEPSCHFIVSNAGLGNGVSREEVANIFARYGTVVNILMKPGKSYCFVSMDSEKSAVFCYEDLNGRTLQYPDEISTEGLIFYLSYIQSVPEHEVVTGDVPQGLLIIEDFVDEAEEKKLLECVDWTTVDKNMTPGSKSSLKHRRVKHYGYEFMYGVNNVDVNCPLEEDIPKECSQVIGRMLDKKLITQSPDQLTVNQYQPGQGIPPHIDTHSAFTDGIVSLSLGSQVVMDFRHPDGRHVPVLLPRRSLAVMTRECRYLWSHGITQRKSDILPMSKVQFIGEAQKLCEDQPLGEKPENDENTCEMNLVKDLSRISFKNDSTSANSRGMLHVNDIDADKSDKDSGLSQGDCSFRSDIGCDFEVTGDQGIGKTSGKLTLVHRSVRTSFTFRKVLGKSCTCKYPAQCDSQQSRESTQSHTVQESRGSTMDISDKPLVPETDIDAQKLEAKLVHQVYEEIAGHFSDTRHSPWPRVVDFLKSIPPGSLVLDVGCGNGKYLGATSKLNYMVGCDRSENLCQISTTRGFPVLVCDCLQVPCRSHSVDVAISIAVIHHLSTKERRQAAVQELVRVLRSGGQALIYVWALEQELNKKKSSYLKDQPAHTAPVSEVVTIMSNETQQASENASDDSRSCSSCSDLQERSPIDETSSGEQNPTSSENKKTKTLTVHRNRTAFASQDLLVPWHLRNKTKRKEQHEAGDVADDDAIKSAPAPVFHRYYHVFKQGELEELCTSVTGVEVQRSYYDQGNWCVILKKTAFGVTR